MNFKKNAFGFSAWIIYTIIAAGGIFCIVSYFGGPLGINIPMLLVVSCICITTIGILSYMLHDFNDGKRKSKGLPGKASKIIEALLFLMVLVGGLMVCFQNIPTEISTTPYYEMAKVDDNQSVVMVVHGASYFYLRFLHMICLLFGNKILIGVYVQIGLYSLSGIVLYFMVKKYAGVVAGIVTFALYFFSSYTQNKLIQLTPDGLYLLLYLLVLYCCVTIMKSRKKTKIKFVLAGVLIACLTYFDITGISVPLFMLPFLNMEKTEENEHTRKGVLLILCCISIIVGLLICFLIDSLLSGKPIDNIFMAWIALFSPNAVTFPVIMTSIESNICVILMFIGIGMGIFSFAFDKRSERISAVTYPVVLLLIFQLVQITTTDMNGSVILYLFLTIWAGIGFAQIFMDNSNAKYKTEISIGNKPAQESNGDIEDMILKEEDNSIKFDDLVEGENTVYIENPLPLPKKHISKTMDYDIEVSDEDNFDI